MSHRRSRRKQRGHARRNPEGILRVTSSGYGFIHTAEGNFFIPRSFMGDAWDGDVVEIVPVSFKRNHRNRHTSSSHHAGETKDTDFASDEDTHRGHRPTARIVAVLRRSHATLVGRYEIADPFGVVIPEDPHIQHDIFTMRKDSPEVHDGDYVRVRIVQYPTAHSAATGKIECVLGHDGDPNIDIDALIDRLNIPTTFSDAAMREAKAAVDSADALADKRRDITDTFVITIDPTDARDFDDAVSLERINPTQDATRWRLGVHIADVSSYVAWGSAIDRDARKRGTSVYLADRVVPMLPTEISNQLCSLVPGQIRRAMTVEAILDDAAHVLSTDIYPSLIRSSARLSYAQADCYIQTAKKGGSAQDAQREAKQCSRPHGAIDIDADTAETLFSMLHNFSDLAEKLSQTRQSAGAIDFASSEAHVLLDDKGNAVGVTLRQRTPATSAIEQAMILANCIVARQMDKSGLPCIYRVHGAPKHASLEKLVVVLQEFGLTRNMDIDAFCSGDPFAIQNVLARVHGKQSEELVSSLVLRAMRRAQYSDACLGHFGLGAQYYCHFTSPIRRYPDLEVHRMLKMKLFGKDATFSAQQAHMASIAQHCSETERIADKAELESTALKLVQYMQGYVGKTFPGIISGISRQGIFVKLRNTAEGLIPLNTLGDEHFVIEDATQQLRGQDSRRRYRLGQRLNVRIFAAPDHATKLELRLA